jgi:hypothetical protein
MLLGPPGALNIKANSENSIVFAVDTGHMVVTEFLGSSGKLFLTNVFHLLGDSEDTSSDDDS